MCSFFYDWDWASAERAFTRCLELTPTSLGARVWYPVLLAAIGRHDEAIAEAKRAVDMLQRLTDLASRSYVSPFCFAQVHFGLGQVEPWRQAMAAALEERAGLLVFLDAAWWDTMRDDPYMAERRRKVGLPALG